MKIRVIAAMAVIIGLFALLSYRNFFEAFDSSLQDTLFQTGGEANPGIIILGIDDSSMKELGRWQDWKRTYFAEVINKLAKAKPAAIGIDVTFSDKSRNAGEDDSLIQAVRNSGNVVLPVKGIFGATVKVNQMEAVDLEEPFRELADAAVTGHINTIPDSDKVVRRSLQYFSYKDRKVNSFAYEIYRMYLKNTKQQEEQLDITLDGYNRWLVNFVEKPGKYDYFPFYRILKDEIPSEYFEGKIILIGPYSQGMLDEYLTPMDYKHAMFGVEIHVNIIQNFIDRSFKHSASDIFNILVVVLLGILSCFLFYKLKPLYATFCFFVLTAIYSVCAITVYKVLSSAVQVFYPLGVMVVIYLAIIIHKYVAELLERKRITGIFGKYTAPEVVKQIIEGGEESLKLGGLRREISVMFVDIRGFTPISEKVQPEEIMDILNEYFSHTVKQIFDFGGTLDKFIGDATMAIFNAPLPLEDHAYKAVRAALDMRAGSEELNAGIFEKYGVRLQFGIGINTGDAVVGNVGTAFRMDYTAIGDTVNTAARLESNAKPGEIIISPSTYELVKDRIRAEYGGEIKLKGKEIPLPVYKVEGEL